MYVRGYLRTVIHCDCEPGRQLGKSTRAVSRAPETIVTLHIMQQAAPATAGVAAARLRIHNINYLSPKHNVH